MRKNFVDLFTYLMLIFSLSFFVVVVVSVTGGGGDGGGGAVIFTHGMHTYMYYVCV